MTRHQKTSRLPEEASDAITTSHKSLCEETLDSQPSLEEKCLEESQRSRSTGIQGNDVLLRLWKEGKLQQNPSLPTNGGETNLAEEFDMALKEYVVLRDNHLPLQFQGYLVGWNEVDLSSTRGTQVCVFVTRKGKIITSVKQWQRERERERHAAAVHNTPQEALDWLITDGGNQLGHASREAWELACRIWPPFEGRDVEVVE